MPLRFGILGTARIARSFVEGVRPSLHATVTCVASRDAAKARAFAQEAGLERHFASYEALLADRDIDAVYIPLPNSMHAEWSIRALQAGKHVLCEKPLSATAAEARAMFDAARQYGVHLVEGYPYRTQPQTLKLRELLDGGAIGDVQLIQGSFGFTLGAGDAVDSIVQTSAINGFLAEADSFARLVSMLTLEAILESARNGRGVEIP